MQRVNTYAANKSNRQKFGSILLTPQLLGYDCRGKTDGQLYLTPFLSYIYRKKKQCFKIRSPLTLFIKLELY